MQRDGKTAFLITQSIAIVSIENSFVLALITFEKFKIWRFVLKIGWFLYALIIKVDSRFSFLTDYSLNFQCPVAKFSPTCCLKNSHHNDIKLFRQNLEELWEKQIKLFTFLHSGFLSNDAVKMWL